MKTQIFSALKSLTVVTLLITGVAYAQVWNPAPPSPPVGNTPAPVNVGGSFQRKLGALDVAGVLTGTRAIFSDRIGIRDAAPDPGLLLDVEGRVGATAYCDQNGANCVTASVLGGGTNAGNLYRCPDAGAYNSGCVGQLQLNDANCDADKTIGGPGTIAACTLVGRLNVQ